MQPTSKEETTLPFPNRIGMCIKRYGYQIQNVADEIGISRRTLSNYISGKKPAPQGILKSIAHTIGCDIEDLLVSRNVPQTSEPAALLSSTSPTVIYVSPSPSSTRAIDALLATREGFPAAPLQQQGIDNSAFSAYAHYQDEREQQLSIHLLLGAGHVAPLLDNGWSPEDVLQTVNSFAKVVQAMPNMSRQQFLRSLARATVAAFVGNIPNYSTEKHITEENRAQLYQALSDSIVSGWQSFHTASNAQVLTLAQAQLYLVQQNHSILSSRDRSVFYTSIYNLQGQALHFQGRDQAALEAHVNAHVAAMGAGDPYHIAQSLACQANSYQALEHHSEAIQAIEEAMRFTSGDKNEDQMRLKAHLLACWAENAMLLRDFDTVEAKLDEASAFLDYLSPNEEFDQASWYQLAGKYAFVSGDYTAAITQFNKAFQALPSHWLVRQVLILLPMMVTYAWLQDRDACITTAQQAFSAINTFNAAVINKQFGDSVQGLLQAFPNDYQVRSFVSEVQNRLSN